MAKTNAGKTASQHVYVHIDALSDLDAGRMEAVMEASRLAGAVAGRDFNVVKLGQEGGVSLLDYPGFFEQPGAKALLNDWPGDRQLPLPQS